MKKIIFAIAIIGVSLTAKASESCEIKVKNAATYEFAQTEGVLVQDVYIVSLRDLESNIEKDNKTTGAYAVVLRINKNKSEINEAYLTLVNFKSTKISFLVTL